MTNARDRRAPMILSIAMATYNGARFLREQLDSFVAQSRQPDELVVNDDCSSDATVEILTRFAGVAPFPVRIHVNERRLGYAGNFNEALLRTTGDLVFLSDQDDVWFPQKLEQMSGVARADPRAMVVMNDAALTFADLSGTGLSKLGQLASAGQSEANFVNGCCAAIRREFLDLCLPLPARCPSHDEWIVGLAVALGRRHIQRDVLQLYRRHGGNVSLAPTDSTAPVFRWRQKMAYGQQLWRNRSVGRNRDVGQVGSVWNWNGARLAWVSRSLGVAPVHLVPELHRLHTVLKHRAERESLRCLPPWKRPREVLSLWRAGRYREASGLRSVVRDLAGF